MYALATKEGVQGMLAFQNEIRNRPMEERHKQSENQIGEIRDH